MTSREPARYEFARERRRLAGRLGIALTLALALVGLGPASRPAEAAVYDRFYANFQGEELMRAINADRAALGRAPLRADPELAAAARDRPITCPSDPGLTIRGRARDLAERSYLSHDVKGCQTEAGAQFSTFDLLAALGHGWATAGENIASNNYPSKKAEYRTGCAEGGGGCDGSIELPWSVAIAVGGWMDSSGHRAVMLSTTFTRFGCGAWQGSSGHNAYACFFVVGGGGSVDRAGPQIRDRSGQGATYAKGSTQTFTARATDRGSLLAQGRALLDGVVIKQWAYDHAGSSDDLSVTVPRLKPGAHTLTWWVRDTSTNTRTASVEFTVAGGAGEPAPTRRPKPDPAPVASPPATLEPAATAPLAQPGTGGEATPEPEVAASPRAVAVLGTTPPEEPRPGADSVAPNGADGSSDGAALEMTIAALGLLALLLAGLGFAAMRRRARPGASSPKA